jgi:hypothetical protein
VDWKRFDWPVTTGLPDDEWFDYLADRGWTLSREGTPVRVEARGYLRFLGWRSRQRR